MFDTKTIIALGIAAVEVVAINLAWRRFVEKPIYDKAEAQYGTRNPEEIIEIMVEEENQNE